MSTPVMVADRRGVALPLALFTLVIAAVMITAVFYVGRMEQRMGNNSIASTQAFEAAETGVATVVSGWIPSAYNSLPLGDSITLPATTVGTSAVYNAKLRRVNPTVFIVQAEGQSLTDGQVTTRRQVARLIRLDPPDIDPRAAVTTRLGDRLQVDGDASISGRDTVPFSWGPVCPPPGPIVPAIIDSAGPVSTLPNCAGGSCLTGNGPIQDNPVLGSLLEINDFDNTTYDRLALAAEKTVTGFISPPNPSGTPCNTADPDNWGEPDDPTAACGEYFPVIHAPNDLTITGGRGQGVLLVDGSLDITGGFVFYGIIIVQGRINLVDAKIIGAVMNTNALAFNTGISGNAQIYFSRCAINRAVTGAAQPSALTERSWVQLY